MGARLRRVDRRPAFDKKGCPINSILDRGGKVKEKCENGNARRRQDESISFHSVHPAILNRLLGLYPSAGRVFLDGHPLEEYDPQQLRRYFHTLLQDLQIYTVTLRENLLMDLPPAESFGLRCPVFVAGCRILGANLL